MILHILLQGLLIAVAQGRVTFTHSEVIQQADLDARTKTTSIDKCENGCTVYGDSFSESLFITDGEVDYTDFQQMNEEPYELLPNTTYKVEFRGEGAPPAFVLYVVDSSAPLLDSVVVRGVNGNPGYVLETKGPRIITLLDGKISGPSFDFVGEFEPGYPRIYATGYDATSEEGCRPVYQARSQENAQHARVMVPSPIMTVDMGPNDQRTDDKAVVQQKASSILQWNYEYSSAVFFSPGYVGCSYTRDQFYFTNQFSVVNVIRADVLSINYDASYSIPTEKEAVHVYINEEEIHLFGDSNSTKRHFEAHNFVVPMDWFRMSPSSYFAIQFDFGAATPRPEDETTTSGSNHALMTLISLIAVVCAVMRR